MPASRLRAASMSASVGTVSVANSEHLLHDLADGRERVEGTALNLVQEPPQLGIVGHRLLEVCLRPIRRDCEHLTREVAPTAFLELALRLQERPVAAHGVPQRLDVVAANRL